MTLDENEPIRREGLVSGRIVRGQGGSFRVYEGTNPNGGVELMNDPLYPPLNKPFWESKRVRMSVLIILLGLTGSAVWQHYEKSKVRNVPVSIPLVIPDQAVERHNSAVTASADIDPGNGHPRHMYEIAIPSTTVEKCQAAMEAAGTLEIDGISECQTPDIPAVAVK